MTSLLYALKTAFSRGLVSHVAARLGEGQHNVRQALNSMVPIVLSAIIAKAEAGHGQVVHGLSLKAYYSVNGSAETVTGLLGILGSGTANDGPLAQGEQALVVLLDRANGTAMCSVIADAGIQPASAQALLSLVAAGLLALLGQHIVRHQLSSEATTRLLIGLKGPVRTMLRREGHDLGKILFRRKYSGRIPVLATPVFRFTAAARRVAAFTAGGVRWYGLGVLALLAIGSLALYHSAIGNPLPKDSAAWSAVPAANAPEDRDSVTVSASLNVPEAVEMDDSTVGVEMLTGEKMPFTED
ncbi:DUF937 domain-containing protein [Hymenobacter terricola]|uniref:DUF937 domain-containing protein n=1 Tax=Hymenobacter terricola TaxID=2819236 RepID=UPI001B30A1B8|nr:DUF937 domain-containing protein [Hymenobacter terricola]